MEKKLDGNYTRVLRAILNKSWRQHPTKQQLYGHLHPITKTIKVRRSRHVGHCWRSRDKLINDVLQWTSIHGRTKAGRPARTYIQQLREDTGYSPEDLPEAMNAWDERREYVKDIGAGGTTRWWYIYIYIYIYVVCSNVSREKLYLLWQKWTMNEIILVFRIQQTYFTEFLNCQSISEVHILI